MEYRFSLSDRHPAPPQTIMKCESRPELAAGLETNLNGPQLPRACAAVLTLLEIEA
jgi:hypothetical protein